MTTPLRRVFLLAWLGLAACAAGRARADFLTHHASTTVLAGAGDVSGNDSHMGAYASSSQGMATYTDSAGTAEGDGSSFSGGAARSYVVWSVGSDAHAERIRGNDSRVDSSASWSDILFLGSTDRTLVGDTLRLSFVAQGHLNAANLDILGFGNPSTSVVLSANNGDGTPGYSAGGGTTLNGSPLDRYAFKSFGWNSISSTNGPNGTEFGGLLVLDVPIPRGRNTGYVGPGSIYFSIVDRSITAIAGTDGNPHSGDVSASDPIFLQSITLPDVGNVTPESLGVSLTFDSGLTSPNVQPVPEPPSLFLFLAGVTALLARARRRQKASATSCRAE